MKKTKDIGVSLKDVQAKLQDAAEEILGIVVLKKVKPSKQFANTFKLLNDEKDKLFAEGMELKKLSDVLDAKIEDLVSRKNVLMETVKTGIDKKKIMKKEYDIKNNILIISGIK